MFLGLLYNTSLLLMLALLLQIFQRNSKSYGVFSKILLGSVIGITGIIIMETAVVLSSGAIFDARSILISAAGLFFGLVPTSIAALIMIIYRVAVGGAGVYAGILSLVTTASIGLLWRHFRLEKILRLNKSFNPEFYFFGLIIHLDVLLCMFAFPKEQIFNIFQTIFWPVILFFPLGTYLLCILLYNKQIQNRLVEDLRKSQGETKNILENLNMERDRLNNIIDGTNAGTWEWNVQTEQQSINEKWADNIGYTLAELEPVSIQTWEKYCHPEDLKKNRKILAEVFLDKMESSNLEFRMKHKDGSWVWINSRGKVNSWTIDGEPLIISGIHIDITRQKQMEETIKANDEIYRLITENISDVISVYNMTKKKFTYFTPSISHLRGLTVAEAMAESIDEALTTESFKLVSDKIVKNMDEFINDPENAQHYITEIQQPCKNGGYVWVELINNYRYTADGDIESIGVSRNITDRKMAEEEIKYISNHDHMTGLYSRNYYYQVIEEINVTDNLPLAVLVADVSGVKIVNDSFGHVLGDELIRKTARVIEECCRAEDVILRWAGDEFVILLPKTTELEVEALICKIDTACEGKEAKAIQLAVSFGYEIKEKEDQIIENILAKAEKNLGKNKIIKNADRKGASIQTIINALHEKNPREEMHSKRVSRYCILMAEAMKLSQIEIDKIKLAAVLHDIGKIALEEGILNKNGPLTDDEWESIKGHPEVGYRIIGSSYELIDIAEYTLAHHERWDGKGYPKGLAGEQIPKIARIIGIADAFDAMTSERTYGQRLSREEALSEISRCGGTQFDPEMVRLFLTIFDEKQHLGKNI